MQWHFESLLPIKLLSSTWVFLLWSYCGNKIDASDESKDQARLLQASLYVLWASKTFANENLWHGPSTLENLKKFARTGQMMLRLIFVLICSKKPRNQASNVKEKSINQLTLWRRVQLTSSVANFLLWYNLCSNTANCATSNNWRESCRALKASMLTSSIICAASV